MQRNSLSKTILATTALSTFVILGGLSSSFAAAEVEQVAITLTDDNGGACVLDKSSVEAGPVTFSVTNKTATALTEVELLNGNPHHRGEGKPCSGPADRILHGNPWWRHL